MPSRYFQICDGPIRGLRLPLNAWVELERANITTLDQLRAVAHQIERIRGIGPQTAQAVQVELARLAPPKADAPKRAV
jgi:hypothetical protein